MATRQVRIFERVRQLSTNQTAARQRIQENRTAQITLQLDGADGNALAGQEVTIRQVRHQFLFGCNAFLLDPDDDSEGQKAYQSYFASLFNYATLPFYWGSYEPQLGKAQRPRLERMARWCREQGILPKGHPLLWHQVPPKWHRSRSLEEVHDLQMSRIRREVTDFRGLIDIWDVVNEAVVMPRFEREDNPITPLVRKIGRTKLLKEAFDTARTANPRAMLVLNDYDHTEAYEQLIAESLEAGVGFDAIGIQSHMHRGYIGSDAIWDVCERFARFGKPLHWTEVTLISGEFKPDMDFHKRYEGWQSTPQGELRQESEVADLYTTLFSHPAVTAITWWDFRDGCWLGAPSGLLREDMSPKPAYRRLLSLIKGEWWTGNLKLKTSSDGQVTFQGFLGDYIIETVNGKAEFSVKEKGETILAIQLG